MQAQADITLLECHEKDLRRQLYREDGVEAAAYVLFGSAAIAADPWSGKPRFRLISHEVIPIEPEEFQSASRVHVTWSTEGFMRLLGEAKKRGLVPGLVHTHPRSNAFFSEQDNCNERELARTALHKQTDLVSLVFGESGAVVGRVWQGPDTVVDAQSISIIGDRLQIFRGERTETGSSILDRQSRLFGPGFNPMVRGLRIAVVGLGGTGSAVAMLLARLGVEFLAFIDKDTIDVTNLNRVHGSRMDDVAGQLFKVDIATREIIATGLGTKVVPRTAWVGDPAQRDLLRSCDVVFGCTDDHQGRIMLNRLAYFYGIPFIDVGLRMRSARSDAQFDMLGRVSVVRPGAPCLLCQGHVSPKRAAEEALLRDDPDEFARRKEEAYVDGVGDPAPAVVTFTTSVASLAVDELIQGLTGFRKTQGMAHNRIRRFDCCEDRSTSCSPAGSCPICGGDSHIWGRGDVLPFLGIIG